MANEADISETSLFLEYQGRGEKGEQVLTNLLKDHTSRQNIYWATDSYASMGEGYTFFDPITMDKITGEHDWVVRPRAAKSKEEQTQRSKDKAEVFTPAWICNAQNNLVDEAWFGRKDGLFNTEWVDDNGQHRWTTNPDKILFPDTEGKTWRDYVADRRIEITCGEAPYLANRYDVVTGEYNEDAIHRIGLLDRKLRIVSENTADSKEWIQWAKVALCSTYGFEWQGDNLLLAREALFFTFQEHYIQQFGEKKFSQNRMRMMPGVAYIISWNLWQMDGLTYGFPGHQPTEESIGQRQKREAENERRIKESTNTFFDIPPILLPHPSLPENPYERFCLVKDWLKDYNVNKSKIDAREFANDKRPLQTFESIVNGNKN